jgi:CheY-like chemotaxis protein
METATTAAFRLLVVEDNPADARLLEEAFAEANVAVEIAEARNGEDALELLRGSLAPEAVILDLNLPRMDGRELLDAIRRDPRLCQLAVVVLSTSHYDADIDTCRRFGVRSYVIKPARFDEFVEIARRIGRLCSELRC